MGINDIDVMGYFDVEAHIIDYPMDTEIMHYKPADRSEPRSKLIRPLPPLHIEIIEGIDP